VKRFILVIVIVVATGLTAVFAAVPVPTPTHDDYSYKDSNLVTGAYAVKILIVLVVMSGLAYGAAKLMKKYNIAPTAFNPDIKVISIKPITGDKKAAIITARGREYLVGISKNNITLIDKFEIAAVKEKRKK
jgi:flagellar biogenesis protein FliO